MLLEGHPPRQENSTTCQIGSLTLSLSPPSAPAMFSKQAGKVKSQTPKVAPTEDKPKKLQGRAKKR